MKQSSISCGEALFVLLGDGGDESPGAAHRARAHVATCARCRDAYAGDQPGAAAIPVIGRSDAATPLRVALLVAAAAQLFFALPWLLGRSPLPDSGVAVSHLTRDGAFALVTATLGALTAWRPRYAHTTMLIGLLVFAAQALTGLSDAQEGNVPPTFEIVHVLVFVIVVGLVAVAADTTRRATPVMQSTPRLFVRSSE